MKVKIKKLDSGIKMPQYAHPGDVGLDVFSREDAEIKPGERKLFSLGFALEFPEGYAAIVKDKSSLPTHHGLHTMGGVFDAGFRGGYNILLVNLGQEIIKIEKRQKIAQIIILPVAFAEFEEVEELSDSSRGNGQFGSTGKF